MTELTDLSETDASNTTITAIDIDEGCAPSGINNAIRNTLGLIRRAFKSSIFRLRDSTDQTKLLAFDLSGLPTGTTVTAKAPRTSGTLSNVPRGHLWGLTLSNNATDATNDIDFAVGECASDSTTPVMMTYTSAMTKRLDANWAAGTGNGGRNSGSAIADTLYRWYAVSKANGADPDFYAHTSDTVSTVLTALQAETGGSDYIYARRIGDVHRASGVIRPFTQDGDTFRLTTGIVDIDATISTARTLHTVTTPPGATAILRAAAFNASAGVLVVVQPVTETDAAVTASNVAPGVSIVGQVAGQNAADTLYVATNASSQIASRASAASTTFRAITIGWIDQRGRLS